MIHTEEAPLFMAGMFDYGEGLESIAEDGNPAILGAKLASETGVPVLFSPGVWAIHTINAPIFEANQFDYGKGLESQAEDGNPTVLAQSLLGDTSIISSSIFSAEKPGPIASGGEVDFSFYANPGQKLSFTTMFGQSNDLFFAPSDAGVELFDANGTPINGDITSQVMFWDAGTEVNQQPGVGPDQAPREKAPNTGTSEHAFVQLIQDVKDGFAYDDVSESIRVTIKATSEPEANDFESYLTGEDNNVDTPATGEAEYHLSDDGTQLSYKITVANIVDVTLAHIHLAPKGQNGPVVVGLYPTKTSTPITGTFSGVLAEGVITAADMSGELAGMPLSALIEKINDGDAYTNVHTKKNPAGEIRGQIEPAQPSKPEDFSNVFFMSLSQGLNMISLPLKPMTEYYARSFAGVLSATVVIKYDESAGRFMGFTLGTPGDGFEIEGGKGYIVNVLKAGTVAFTGAAWTNEPSGSEAPPISNDSAWAFIVSGSLQSDDSMNVKGDNYTVTVKNLRTNATVTETANSNGYFSAVYADLNRKAVIENQDSIEITVMDTIGNIVSGPYIYKVTSDNIRNATVNIPMKLGNLKPTMSVLLPNYPNPFNPETWLPYQLKDASTVSVKIYSSMGQLIRTLDLGQKDAGAYASQSKAAYWDGKNEAGEKVASGTYFYSIKAGNFSAIRKMVVNK
ncbi:MAG: hypothetical protein QG588_89 [Candidatus Poribacteria bacterium]|nr:hypothetical protein [Candidatus Poribacteria bacterium]